MVSDEAMRDAYTLARAFEAQDQLRNLLATLSTLVGVETCPKKQAALSAMVMNI